MVRWRACLMLAVLLLLPRTGGKVQDDDDEDTKTRDNGDDILRSRNDDAEDEEEDDDDDDDEEPSEKPDPAGRRSPLLLPSPKPQAHARTVKKLPLECFVCAYKSSTPLRSCLDPAKYRVHSITCHNVEDKCFTSVIARGKSYDAVVRGCRSGCVPSDDTKCCEVNRCNNQPFAMPVVARPLVEAADDTSKAAKGHPSSVLFFVTILLVLQTVVKVSFV